MQLGSPWTGGLLHRRSAMLGLAASGRTACAGPDRGGRLARASRRRADSRRHHRCRPRRRERPRSPAPMPSCTWWGDADPALSLAIPEAREVNVEGSQSTVRDARPPRQAVRLRLDLLGVTGAWPIRLPLTRRACSRRSRCRPSRRCRSRSRALGSATQLPALRLGCVAPRMRFRPHRQRVTATSGGRRLEVFGEQFWRPHHVRDACWAVRTRGRLCRTCPARCSTSALRRELPKLRPRGGLCRSPTGARAAERARQARPARLQGQLLTQDPRVPAV